MVLLIGRLVVEGALCPPFLVRDAVYAWCSVEMPVVDGAGVGSCSCFDTRDGFFVAFVFRRAIPSSRRRVAVVSLPSCSSANESSSIVRSISVPVGVLDEDASGVGTGGLDFGLPAVSCEETDVKLRDVSKASWTFGKDGPTGLES